jgi:hypothetical protein
MFSDLSTHLDQTSPTSDLYDNFPIYRTLTHLVTHPNDGIDNTYS